MKRGVTETVPMLVILLVVVALLMLFTGELTKLLSKAGIGQERSIAPFVSAYLRDPITQIEVLKLEFPIRDVLIDKDAMKNIRERQLIEAVKLDYFPLTVHESDEYISIKKTIAKLQDEKDQKQIVEWKANQMIADELEDCWHDMGEGKLLLFSKWWERVGGGLKESELDDEWEQYLNENHLPQMPPIFCVICARIEFDKELQGILDPVVSKRFMDYLRRYPTRGDDEMSILNYLRDPLVSNLYTKEYSYSTTEPYAIVFARVNTHRLYDYAEFIGNRLQITRKEGNDEDFSTLVMASMEDLDLYCTTLANS
ncbi:MAG: hypothetical protein ABIH34_05705 [Nanoarchaeota archaeon]